MWGRLIQLLGFSLSEPYAINQTVNVDTDVYFGQVPFLLNEVDNNPAILKKLKKQSAYNIIDALIIEGLIEFEIKDGAKVFGDEKLMIAKLKVVIDPKELRKEK